MDSELKNTCARIVQCLIRYGGLEEADARRLVDEARLCEAETEVARNMLLHETAYYWAMALLYGGGDPEDFWFHNPDLWPPPEDYYVWLKEWFESNPDG